MGSEYKILSFDQALNCGYAIGNKGKVVSYGVLTSKEKEFDYAVSDIKKQIVKIIAKEKPMIVTIEAVHHGFSVDTTKKLSRLQGVLINYFIENQILFEIISPSSWQGNEGFKGKKKKLQSYTKAVLEFNDESITEDMADAIWMCKYAMEKINIVKA